jgi:hypothetical protein
MESAPKSCSPRLPETPEKKQAAQAEERLPHFAGTTPLRLFLEFHEFAAGQQVDTQHDSEPTFATSPPIHPGGLGPWQRRWHG